MILFQKILGGLALTVFMIVGLWFILRKEQAPDGKILLTMNNSDGFNKEHLAAFNRLDKRLHVSLQPGDDNVMEILVQNAAGTGADLIGNISENNILTFDSVGLLKDLTPLARGTLMASSMFHPTVAEAVSVRDVDDHGVITTRQVAVPANVQHTFIIYNKNIFDRLNVDYPSHDLTWDEYIDTAAKLTVAAPKALTPEIMGAVGVNPYVLIWEFGGDFFNQAGTRCQLDSPEAIQAMVYYHRLIHELKTEPIQSQSGMDEQDFRLKAFVGGQIAMLWVSRRALPYLRREIFKQQTALQVWQQENPGKPYSGIMPLKLGAALLPRFADGRRVVNMKVEGVGINVRSRRQSESLQFLSFLVSPQYNAMFRDEPCGSPPLLRFNTVGTMTDHRFPEELEITRTAIQCWNYGRLSPRCPFVSANFVEREFQQTRFKIAMSPALKPEDIAVMMRQTADKINQAIRYAVEHEKTAGKLYERLEKSMARR